MFEKYTKDILKAMKNGRYLLKYDPNAPTDFWPPNDEVVSLVDGQLIDDRGIRFDISQVSCCLEVH